MHIIYGRGTYGHIDLLENFKSLGPVMTVGNFCSIAKEVSAVVTGHDLRWLSTFPFTHKDPFFKARNIKGLPVTYKLSIGNDVWLGRKVMLVGNVTIGDGCVVGAGSVVRGEFEPYSIIIGNPATCVKKRFTDKQINRLLEIKWWEWPDEKINDNVHLLCSIRIDDFIRKHMKGKI